MKNRATVLMKVVSTLAAMLRSKTMAFKSKTRAFKTRLVIFSLIHNRKFLVTSISHKLNALIKPKTHNQEEEEGEEKAMEEEEEDELQRRGLYDDGEGGSVIEMVKREKLGEEEEFRLEDEIDRVADLFIERFHRQMRLQKQLSFEDTP